MCKNQECEARRVCKTDLYHNALTTAQCAAAASVLMPHMRRPARGAIPPFHKTHKLYTKFLFKSIYLAQKKLVLCQFV